MEASNWLWLAIAAGIIAVVYGVVSMMSILRLPAGNARMQEIAAAIQAGAKAYLNRQYLTITIVGVVLFAVIGFSRIGWPTGHLHAPPVSQKAPHYSIATRQSLKSVASFLFTRTPLIFT